MRNPFAGPEAGLSGGVCARLPGCRRLRDDKGKRSSAYPARICPSSASEGVGDRTGSPVRVEPEGDGSCGTPVPSRWGPLPWPISQGPTPPVMGSPMQPKRPNLWVDGAGPPLSGVLHPIMPMCECHSVASRSASKGYVSRARRCTTTTAFRRPTRVRKCRDHSHCCHVACCHTGLCEYTAGRSASLGRWCRSGGART